ATIPGVPLERAGDQLGPRAGSRAPRLVSFCAAQQVRVQLARSPSPSGASNSLRAGVRVRTGARACACRRPWGRRCAGAGRPPVGAAVDWTSAGLHERREYGDAVKSCVVISLTPPTITEPTR